MNKSKCIVRSHHSWTESCMNLFCRHKGRVVVSKAVVAVIGTSLDECCTYYVQVVCLTLSPIAVDWGAHLAFVWWLHVIHSLYPVGPVGCTLNLRRTWWVSGKYDLFWYIHALLYTRPVDTALLRYGVIFACAYNAYMHLYIDIAKTWQLASVEAHAGWRTAQQGGDLTKYWYIDTISEINKLVKWLLLLIFLFDTRFSKCDHLFYDPRCCEQTC